MSIHNFESCRNGDWIYRSKKPPEGLREPVGDFIEIEVHYSSGRYGWRGVEARIAAMRGKCEVPLDAVTWEAPSFRYPSPDPRNGGRVQVKPLARKNDKQLAAVALLLDSHIPELAALAEQDISAAIARLKQIVAPDAKAATA